MGSIAGTHAGNNATGARCAGATVEILNFIRIPLLFIDEGLKHAEERGALPTPCTPLQRYILFFQVPVKQSILYIIPDKNSMSTKVVQMH
jgi:hypothetical protein